MQIRFLANTAVFPLEDDYSRMARLASNNVLVARLYLGIKILGTTILEALALATGGDAPLSLFHGRCSS